MSYYASYVMDHVIGLDMVKEVNNYMSHPFTESRNIRADEMYSAIQNIKEEYLFDLNEMANKISRAPYYSIEDRNEVNEQLGDIYFEMNSFVDYDEDGNEKFDKYKLMRFKPRVNKSELYLQIENRENQQLLKYMRNITGLNTIKV
tara:strand:+ start:5890 stop:6327 length:438 start_codon:yes stop_codon:yes gene_type:complete